MLAGVFLKKKAMLSKKNRLVAERDFSKLFAKGKSYSGRGIGMKMVKTPLSVTRVGFVVSTKVSKRAVVRNRIKRRMREAMRAFLPKLSQSGMDIAFMARSETVSMEYVDIQRSIQGLLEKSGLVPGALVTGSTKPAAK
ncbi:MAG: hypothetical protein RLZZ324_1350 [Candidatus Parcubacteria bacterium]|jgi:ribonuclease P protein component